MPIVRYQIRNEYGQADPGLYGAADKGDPEALLEGVAMAGLVGILRQLGDLAEFAAEIFHDLHEEVMATSSRGNGLLLRVQQLEAEFPVVEKCILNLKEQPQINSSSGVDWHPNLHIDRNLVTGEDMPRFILDCYEESRGPPRLFMLDKFDSAEDGACLKRYSDPSFFKTNFVSGANVETGFHPEKGFQKNKKKVPRWNDGIISEVQIPQLADDKLELPSMEQAYVNQYEQVKHIRLKKRQLNTKIDIGKQYLDSIRDPPSAEVHALPEHPVQDSQEVTQAIMLVKLLPQERASTFDDPNLVVNFKERNLHNPPTACQKTDVPNQIKSEEILEKSSEHDNNHSLVVTECYRRQYSPSSNSKSSCSLNDYRTDDVGSELENYLDALATMESEIETDEAKSKLDHITFIKEYPKFASNEKQDRQPDQIFYSGDDNFLNKDVTNGTLKKSPGKHKSLPSQCSFEEPPCIIKDPNGACTPDNQASEISGNECSGVTVMNQVKNSNDAVRTVDLILENDKSAAVGLSSAERSDEFTDACSDREEKCVNGSMIENFVMNLVPSDLFEDPTKNDEAGEDSLLPRNPIILSVSPADQAGFNLQVVGNENLRSESFNSDLGSGCLPSDAEISSLSSAAHKDSQLVLAEVENHVLENSLYHEPGVDTKESTQSSGNSDPIASVDHKSSTAFAVGDLETGNLLNNILPPDNDDTAAEYSGKSTQSDIVVANKSCEESFVKKSGEAMVNDSLLESDEPVLPDADASSPKGSPQVSVLNSGEPAEHAEKDMSPRDGGELSSRSISGQNSLNPLGEDKIQSEISVAELSDISNFVSTPDHKDNAYQMKENDEEGGATSVQCSLTASGNISFTKLSPKQEASMFQSLREPEEESLNQVQVPPEQLSEVPDFLHESETKLVQPEQAQMLPLDEDPPLPPLPPIQWRVGKLRPGLFPSMEGMKSTLSPASDQSCGSPLTGTSQEQQRIETCHEISGLESNEHRPSPQPPLIRPIYFYPEPSNPFLSIQSPEHKRTSKEMIIEGYFSDSSLSREAISRSFMGYHGFHMYASEDERISREDYQKPIRRPSSLLNRPRDPLIEAVAAHDKSTLRRVSEMAQTSAKSNDASNNTLLDQIRKKSFNLRPAAAVKPVMKAPPTNLKVAAILEKANAIRQAVAGSDEDDDRDSWSDA